MTRHFTLRWENLTLEVTDGESFFFRSNLNTKTVLKNVSGWASSNSLVAILGSSGAGKSTMTKILAGKIRAKHGEIKLNDKVITSKQLRNISGYLPQDDVFTKTLTVYEHMVFMAAMKINETRDHREVIIGQLLRDLSLHDSRNTLIKHLSGGQKRRLSLASELLDDPHILFCDEATTGLDSFSAVTVIKKLQEFTTREKIVLVTVHQPSSQLFDLFDNIILLANGNMAFQGTKQEVKEFFSSQNLICPSSYNPADFYIKCLSGPQIADKLCNKFYKKNQIKSKCLNNDTGNFFIITHRNERYFKKSFFYELYWLMWRTILDYLRNVRIFYTNMALIMVTAVIVSLSYGTVTLGNQGSVQSIQGALSVLVTEVIFDNMYQVIYIFPEEIEVFVKEKSLYSSCPYFLSKFFSMIPSCIVLPLIFWLIYFLPLKFLNGVSLFFDVYLALFAASICGTAFGLCLSALFSTVEYLNLVIMPYETLCMMLSGIWVRLDSLPNYLKKIKYLSPFFLTFQSISNMYWMNIKNFGNCTELPDMTSCFENGKDVLEEYDLLGDYSVILNNYLYLSGLTCIFCYIGYIGILRKRALYSD